jgi:hypothetical protein
MKVIVIKIETTFICFCPHNNSKLGRLKFEVTAISKTCKMDTEPIRIRSMVAIRTVSHLSEREER